MISLFWKHYENIANIVSKIFCGFLFLKIIKTSKLMGFFFFIKIALRIIEKHCFVKKYRPPLTSYDVI